MSIDKSDAPAIIEAPAQRPRLIVDIEDETNWPTGGYARDALYLIHGETWVWEPVGCVLCVEKREESISFQSFERPDEFLCLRCGYLASVPYEMRRTYRVRVGPLEREGEEVIRDAFLVPYAFNDKEELKALLERLLDEACLEEEREDDHD